METGECEKAIDEKREVKSGGKREIGAILRREGDFCAKQLALPQCAGSGQTADLDRHRDDCQGNERIAFMHPRTQHEQA